MSWWSPLLGAYLGGFIPVLVQFGFEWRERPVPLRDWPVTALFILGWPFGSAYAAWQLFRGRSI